MSTTPSGAGARLRPRLPPATTGSRAARRGAAAFALFQASIRRALGLRRSWRQKVAPFVLLAIARPGDRQRRRRLRHPRPGGDRDRVHHLPRLRRRVDRAAAVRRARRARHRVSRPPPARAAPDLRPPADRSRLRVRQARRDLRDALRLLVHPPGRAVRRPDARQRRRARLRGGHAEVLWQVPVSVALLASTTPSSAWPSPR